MKSRAFTSTEILSFGFFSSVQQFSAVTTQSHSLPATELSGEELVWKFLPFPPLLWKCLQPQSSFGVIFSSVFCWELFDPNVPLGCHNNLFVRGVTDQMCGITK